VQIQIGRKEDLVAMLNNHLKFTTQEVLGRLNGKWDEDIAAFDKIFIQAMEMADALSDGIINNIQANFKPLYQLDTQ